ncbi:MAG: pentapeptide repeat-containing protein [Flavobacteriaceae bacterium]
MNYLKILVGSLLALFPFYALGACGLPDGLNEKKQFAFAEKMIEDGLLTSARDYLQCYRASKPQGEFRFVAMKLEGEVLLQMGESYWPQAQILFEEWLQENPNDVEGDFARLQLGKIHFRFDRPQVAEETLSSIPSSSSLYGPARNLMGQALFQRMLRYIEKNATTQAYDLAPRIEKYHKEALRHSLSNEAKSVSLFQSDVASKIIKQIQYTDLLSRSSEIELSPNKLINTPPPVPPPPAPPTENLFSDVQNRPSESNQPSIFDRKYPPLLFESTNSSKNTLEKSSTVEDITPPRITILSPTNAFRAIKPLVRGKVLYVRGKAFDDSGVFEVLVNNKDAPLNALGEFESEVRMAVGENLITVSAEDLKGNKSTKSFTVLRESASLKKTTPGTLQPISLKGNYYALLLAVNDYQHASMLDLKNPINDARRLKAVLSKKYGFKNIELIENPDRPKLISSLENLRSRITDKDSLLVFFAGHGYWDEEIEQGYWLPSNAERDNPVEWVSNGTLRDYLRGIKSRHTLLISDACFSGGILNTRSVINLAGPGYQELNKLRSRKAMTSGTLNEVPDRSIFIDYLIQRLDQNEEPLLSSYQLFSSLRLAVINNSPTRQVPQYGDIQQAGDEGGDFIFIKSTEEIVSESQTKQAAFKSEVGTQQKEHSNQKTPEVTVFDEDRLVRQWMEWQEQMQQEFENTQALSKKSVDSSKKVEAWRLFLSNWARENPYSKLDNLLRSDAESQKNYWAEPKIEEVAERPVLYKKESGKMALDELVSKRECIGCDLSDIDLSGLNLGGVNLLEAKLIYTKMRDTYLKQSNLSMANMTYADLSRANLSEANLNNATLWFTNLRGATLKNANLREADLSEADLSSANLVGADLRETNLRETNLSYSYLTGANLTGANLTGARFCKTMMPNGSINNEDC